MPKLSPVKPKKLIRQFLKAGFYIDHQTGSHVHLRHEYKKHLRLNIPRHDRFALPPSLLNRIRKQAELTREEFFNLIKK